MNVIVRNFKHTVKHINVKSVSLSYDEPGIFIESDDYEKLLIELADFNPSMVGKIIRIDAKSISLFD